MIIVGTVEQPSLPDAPGIQPRTARSFHPLRHALRHPVHLLETFKEQIFKCIFHRASPDKAPHLLQLPVMPPDLLQRVRRGAGPFRIPAAQFSDPFIIQPVMEQRKLPGRADRFRLLADVTFPSAVPPLHHISAPVRQDGKDPAFRCKNRRVNFNIALLFQTAENLIQKEGALFRQFRLTEQHRPLIRIAKKRTPHLSGAFHFQIILFQYFQFIFFSHGCPLSPPVLTLSNL